MVSTTIVLTLSCPELLNWEHRVVLVPSSAMEDSESRHSQGIQGSDYMSSTSLKKDGTISVGVTRKLPEKVGR